MLRLFENAGENSAIDRLSGKRANRTACGYSFGYVHRKAQSEMLRHVPCAVDHMDDFNRVIADAEQNQVRTVQRAAQVRRKVGAGWERKRTIGNFTDSRVQFLNKAFRPVRIIRRDLLKRTSVVSGKRVSVRLNCGG